MRALLVTQEGITEVSLGPEYEKCMAVVENRQPNLKNVSLDAMYRHIGCNLVEGAGYPDSTHAAWVDEEGLFNLYDGCQFTVVDWAPGAQFVGKLLVTGFDPKTGDTTAATMSVEELESRVMVGEGRM